MIKFIILTIHNYLNILLMSCRLSMLTRARQCCQRADEKELAEKAHIHCTALQLALSLNENTMEGFDRQGVIAQE